MSTTQGSKCNVLTSTEGLPYEDWLEYRKLGLGGSDASVVCGINRWKSPIELFMEKTGMFPYEEAGEAAYWGTVLEGLVKSEFTKRTGIDVVPVNQILQHEDYPFMLANIDGICQHPIYGPCIFEAKTTSAYNAGDWDDSVPDVYLLQVMHYMAVTGFMGAYVAVLIGGNTFRWRFVERDDDLISMLIQLEAEFWERVQSNVPPPLDGSEATVEYLKARFPNSVPQSRVELPDEAVSLIRQYEAACVEVDKYTEHKQEAENLLKQMLGEHEVGVVGCRIATDEVDGVGVGGDGNDGVGVDEVYGIGNNGSGSVGERNIGEYVVSWKSVTQERLDSKTLKAEHPRLYKKYANSTSHRRFSVKQAVRQAVEQAAV